MMVLNRRMFLSSTCGLSVGLLARRELHARPKGAFPMSGSSAYKYRIAFELWINDVRDEAMPLENWPYAVLDDKTVDGIKRGLDLQSEAGYNAIDFCGLF